MAPTPTLSEVSNIRRKACGYTNVWFRSAAGGHGHSTQGFIRKHVVRVSGISCESGIGLQFIMTFAPHSYVDFVLYTIEKIREIKIL